jgi:hypothetical protein
MLSINKLFNYMIRKASSFSILVLMIAFYSVSGQGIFKCVEFSIGYGTVPQDRRLFDYPLQDNVLATEETSYDHQYDFMLNKDLFYEKRLNINTALGYSLYKNKFGRPFDHNYLTEGMTKELRHVGTYNMHNLKLSISPEYYFSNKEKSKFCVVFPLDINFTFNKGVIAAAGKWRSDTWLFSFRNFEIFSGLKYKHGKFSISLTYRIYNIQDIDNLIFYSILFIHPHPPFLQNKSEKLNPNKLLFNIGYTF